LAKDEITQAEADALFAMEKRRTSSQRLPLPQLGAKLSVDLVSPDERERFNLDLTSSYVSLSKFTMQTRARAIVVLARLDIDGAPHRNPDDAELPATHLHLFREGYGDKWAYPIPNHAFRDLSNRWVTLEDFMKYCNITEPPEFESGLFS
jgi:hypothetical protein